SGKKTWVDEDSRNRPDSITIKLYANGEEIDEIEVTEEDGWTYQFTELQAFDDQGQAIEYTIDEVPVEGYETTVNGYDVTNTFDPGDPSVPVDPEDPEDPTDPEDPEKPTDPKDPG